MKTAEYPRAMPSATEVSNAALSTNAGTDLACIELLSTQGKTFRIWAAMRPLWKGDSAASSTGCRLSRAGRLPRALCVSACSVVWIRHGGHHHN